MCNDLRFPNFVANACCNPCCDRGVSAQRVESVSDSTTPGNFCIPVIPCCPFCCGHGCGSVGGTNNQNCGDVGGVSDGCDCGCGGNVGGVSDGCDCGCGGNVGGIAGQPHCSCHRRCRR